MCSSFRTFLLQWRDTITEILSWSKLRIPDCSLPSSYIYNRAPTPKAQGTSQKRIQRTRTSVLWRCFLYSTGIRPRENSAIWLPKQALYTNNASGHTSKRGANLVRPHPRWRDTGNWGLLRKGKSVLSKNEPSDNLSNPKRPFLNTQVWATLNGLNKSCVYVFIFFFSQF